MRNGQVDLGSFTVGRRMEADAVHLQLTSNLQDLEVRLGRRLAPGQGKKKTIRRLSRAAKLVAFAYFQSSEVKWT